MPAESKAVVLVTDGVDTASATSFDTLRELARRAEVPVFSIGLDAGEVHPYHSRPPGRGGGGHGGGGGGPVEAGGGWRAGRPGGGPGGGGWGGGGHGGGPSGGGRRAAGRRLRRQAPERARRRHRRARRDRQGASSTTRPGATSPRERPTEGGGRVDRHDAAPPLPARLRAPGRQARLADDPRRRRPSRRHRARRGRATTSGADPGSPARAPLNGLPGSIWTAAEGARTIPGGRPPVSLAAGSRLGPYEIVSPLGAGGMGEVYRARDTRLGRRSRSRSCPPTGWRTRSGAPASSRRPAPPPPSTTRTSSPSTRSSQPRASSSS